MSPTLTLEGMPAEIRGSIYAQISPPFNNHLDAFHGIVSANHYLHKEAKYELIRNMTLFLGHIVKEWRKAYDSFLRIDMPTTVASISNIKIAIPLSALYKNVFIKFPTCLLPLLEIQISSLTITVYKDDDWEGNYPFPEKFLMFGLMSLLRRIGQTLDKCTVLFCDDGILRVRKSTFSVHTVTVAWNDIDVVFGRASLWGIAFENLKHRQFEYIAAGPKTIGCVWNRLYSFTLNGKGQCQDMGHTRDLRNY
jgi:hypothetical protein